MTETRPKYSGKCPCGSGKKYKRCCFGKKPRYITASFDISNKPGDQLTVQISDEGRINFLCDGKPFVPQQAFTGIHIDQSGTEKKTVSMTQDSSQATWHPDIALRKFDWLIAIDTNTQKEQGISVTCVRGFELRTPGGKFGAFHRFSGALEFREATAIEERIGWWRILESLSFSNQLRFAVVVDHDIEAHWFINAREQPIFGDFFLPMQCQMMYASTDKRNDSLANKLLNLVDRDAKDLLQIIAGVSDDGLKQTIGLPYSSERHWTKSQPDSLWTPVL